MLHVMQSMCGFQSRHIKEPNNHGVLTSERVWNAGSQNSIVYIHILLLIPNGKGKSYDLKFRMITIGKISLHTLQKGIQFAAYKIQKQQANKLIKFSVVLILFQRVSFD